MLEWTSFFTSCVYKLYFQVFFDRSEAEGVIDTGGATRELLDLCMKQAKSSVIFQGPDNHRQLCRNASGKIIIYNIWLIVYCPQSVFPLHPVWQGKQFEN